MKINIVDFAYQIIELHEENQRLKARNKHLEELNDLYFNAHQDSRKHTERMTGALLLHAIGSDDAAVELLERK